MAGPKEGQNANQSTNQAGNLAVIRNLDNNRDGNKENAESRNAGNVKRKISVYQQAALMQPRIAPAPAQQKKKSKSAWGTIKHGLFTALSALSTATVGGFFRLAARAVLPPEKSRGK